MNRRAAAVAIAAGLLAAVVSAWVLGHRTPPLRPEAGQPEIPLATVREGEVERTIELPGRVGPVAGTQTKLAFPLPGTVLRIDVRLGQVVQTGTPLGQIDATSYSLAAQQAGADAVAAAAAAAATSVDRVSVKLRVDDAELQRKRRLFGAGVVSLRDVQAAQATVAADGAEAQSARDQVAAAHAQSSSANAHAASTGYDLARTTLRAPATGTVTGIFVQPGDAVNPTVPAVALTPALGHVATLDAPVSDVLRIAPGELVRARSNGRRFDARVAGVAPAVNPATGLATIDIRGVPGDLPAGTPLDATIVVGHARGSIVPRGAIVEDPENGNTLVFVQQRAPDGSAHFESRVVRVGAQSAELVCVTGGLRAGERVAAQGAIDLLAPASDSSAP